MASSRLEKIGNIFTRINGLLKSGAMRPEDKPLFFDIYKSFPPLKEPKYWSEIDESIKIRPIFYPEDQDRASRDDSSTLFHLNEMSARQPETSTFQRTPQQQTSAPSAPREKQEKIFNLTELTDLKQ